MYNGSLHSVLSRYPGVFQEGLGTLKGFKAKIYVEPDTLPRFNPARSVPYALRDKVETTPPGIGYLRTGGVCQVGCSHCCCLETG